MSFNSGPILSYITLKVASTQVLVCSIGVSVFNYGTDHLRCKEEVEEHGYHQGGCLKVNARWTGWCEGRQNIDNIHSVKTNIWFFLLGCSTISIVITFSTVPSHTAPPLSIYITLVIT